MKLVEKTGTLIEIGRNEYGTTIEPPPGAETEKFEYFVNIRTPDGRQVQYVCTKEETLEAAKHLYSKVKVSIETIAG